VLFTREQFEKRLPEKNTIKFIEERCKVDGKAICSKYFGSDAEDLSAVLSMEAGLSAWHQPPVPGAVSEWPWVLKEILEHVRGVAILIEHRRNKELEKKVAAKE